MAYFLVARHYSRAFSRILVLVTLVGTLSGMEIFKEKKETKGDLLSRDKSFQKTHERIELSACKVEKDWYEALKKRGDTVLFLRGSRSEPCYVVTEREPLCSTSGKRYDQDKEVLNQFVAQMHSVICLLIAYQKSFAQEDELYSQICQRVSQAVRLLLRVKADCSYLSTNPYYFALKEVLSDIQSILSLRVTDVRYPIRAYIGTEEYGLEGPVCVLCCVSARPLAQDKGLTAEGTRTTSLVLGKETIEFDLMPDCIEALFLPRVSFDHEKDYQAIVQGNTVVEKQLLQSGYTPLHIAILRLNEAQVKKLVSRKTVKAHVEGDITPVCLALRGAGCLWSSARLAPHFMSRYGEVIDEITQRVVRVLKLLIASGADVQLSNPLALAIQFNVIDYVQVLLEAQADPNAQDSFGKVPLYWAISGISMDKSREAMVKVLLEAKADPNKQDAFGATSLCWAIRKRDEALVKHLLKAQADPRIGDLAGTPPLAWAVQGNMPHIVQLLCDAQDSDKASLDGSTLYRALGQGRRETLECLLALKAKLVKLYGAGKEAGFASFGDSMSLAILFAESDFELKVAQCETESSIQQVVKDTAHLFYLLSIAAARIKNKTDTPFDMTSEGVTALLLAAKLGFPRVSRFLIDLGANVRVADRDKKTVLFYAAQQGLVEVWKPFLENDLDLRFEGALLIAAEHGHTDLCELLVQRGAPLVNVVGVKYLDFPDIDGNTPLAVAARAGHTGVCKLLIEKGADIHRCNKYGFTPLLYATQQNLIEICTQLVKKGANVHDTDEEGISVLQSAARLSTPDLATFYLAYMPFAVLSLHRDIKVCNERVRTALLVLKRFNCLADLVPIILCSASELEQDFIYALEVAYSQGKQLKQSYIHLLLQRLPFQLYKDDNFTRSQAAIARIPKHGVSKEIASLFTLESLEASFERSLKGHRYNFWNTKDVV